MVNTIQSTDGFWIYNPSINTADINPYNCSQYSIDDNHTISDMPDFTYGDSIIFTASGLLTNGHVYFEADDNGYEKITVSHSDNSDSASLTNIKRDTV